MREIIVDNFAGGGGASLGMEFATGESPAVAINHDPDAIAMHRVNHPDTKHYCESVWDVDPREAAAGRPVGLVWFSPDCKHFSKAKGSIPVKKEIRGLAWVAVRWAATVRPRVMMLENVEEFKTWGPVIPQRDEETGRIMKKVPNPNDPNKYELVVSEPGEIVPHDLRVYYPDPKRKGFTFNSFVNALKRHGYDVEWRELRACDYGAPTSRKRLFMAARCDGRPIVWPEPTHGAPDSPEVLRGERLPWRTAAEIIDWSIPTKSIFGRKKELADNTKRRIARGIHRYVINNPRPFVYNNPSPFVMKVNHSGEQFRGQEIDQPLQTVTAKNGWSIVTPYIARIGQTGFGSDRLQYELEEPLTTVTTKAEHLLITPVLNTYTGERPGRSTTEALRTSPRGQHLRLVSPTLIQMGYTERNGQAPRVLDLKKPVGTITAAGNKFAVAEAILAPANSHTPDTTPGMIHEFLAKHGGNKSVKDSADSRPVLDTDDETLVTAHIARHFGQSVGSPACAPIGAITAGGGGKSALVTSHLIKFRGTCLDGQPVTEPMPTITAGGTHVGEVRTFLQEYYRDSDDNEPADNLGTVTIEGIEYQIVDIGMRMLEPHELFAAQGFPKNYIIDVDDEGNKYPKSKQVARCGNAVPPIMPKVLIRANVPELCVGAGKMLTLERYTPIEGQLAFSM
ncbi:DNA cytosine methyltransferase [Paenibacillus glucanolyticus]|uniref:DNA cytosine methyltransferase n=1 Tax=Paenibacillus glucanolyticus TaxID=59843 RepID=UPI00096E1334|nr:DNA cytosine methyltransferase [Paenibacillus glucanolyticus]OMF76739.1 DNA (cytosine-5-)-methyltransferase [Paenibacillus glucanolyticus]